MTEQTYLNMELHELVSKITPHLNAEKLTHDTSTLQNLLPRFRTNLNQLLEHSDQEENAPLTESIRNYNRRWLVHSEISYAPLDFIRETKMIFQHLA